MLNNEKGITMVALIIAIILMLIITSTLIFSSRNGLDISKLNKMYEDIQNLDGKISVYYSKHKTLPIKEKKYENVNNIKNINVNDNDNYYVIDIENIDNLTLNYGLDYKNYETNNNIEDVYVINEKSHTIYYIKGIEIDGSRYYTTNANYTEVIVPKWSNVYNNTEEFIDLNGDKATIPAGFQISLQQGENTILDGLVIRNATDLNEFVWIPCNIVKYDRYAFDANGWVHSQTKQGLDEETNSYKILDSADVTKYYIETIDEQEQASIKKYGGFYIGRYETGIEEGELYSSSNDEMYENWTGYNSGNVVIKKDSNVWNYITMKKAKEIAQNLYKKDEDNVTSKLCSSYAWDTTLKFIETSNTNYATNSTNSVYERENIQKTGTQKSVNNIYDIAGNVEEWTLEEYSDATRVVSRGGNYENNASESPAAYRNINGVLYASDKIGFRIMLYL